MELQKTIDHCIRFINSMIQWANNQRAIREVPNPQLENMRREFLIIRGVILKTCKDPYLKRIGNARNFIEIYNRLRENPPPLTNRPHSDSDSDSNDSVIEVYSSLKESEKCSKREYTDSESEPSSSKLQINSNQAHNKEAAMIRVKQYIRENLSVQVDETSQNPSEPDRETSDTNPSLGSLVTESVSTDNSDGSGRNNETGSTGGQIPGRNKAVRSFKNQRAQPVASTSHDRISPKTMTLRSSTIKKEFQGEDSTKASTSSPSTNSELDDQKIMETTPVKRPRGRPRKAQESPNNASNEKKKKPEKRQGPPIIPPNEGKKKQVSEIIAPNEGKKRPEKRQGSPIIASDEEKKRPVGRPKGSSKKKLAKTAKYNPSESEAVHPTSPEVDEYHKYNKKRRAMTKFNQNDSQNFTRQTRSSKTSTNTELAKDHGKSTVGSEGDNVKRITKAQALEKSRIAGNGSHKHSVKRNNMKTREHVQTDPDSISQYSDTVKDEESPETDVENNNVSPGDNVQTNETVKDEESQDPRMEDESTKDNEDSGSVVWLDDDEPMDVQTDEEPQRESSLKDEEWHELNVEDDNASNRGGRDDDNQSVIYLDDDEESLDNRAIIRNESTDEDPLRFKDEESREYDPESGIFNIGDHAQTDEWRQAVVKNEKSSERKTKNNKVNTTEGDGDEDNRSIIYLDDDDEPWEPKATGGRKRDNVPENQNKPEDEGDEEEDSVAESQKRRQINPTPGPIQLIDISSDESDHNSLIIDLGTEGNAKENTWKTNLPVKEEDDDDSNLSSGQVVTCQAESTMAHENVSDVEVEVESRESQSRRAFADNPEAESDSELESEGGFASEHEIRNDPEESCNSDREDLTEAERMEAGLANLGQIVAMKVRGQQLRSSHADPDSTSTRSVAGAAKRHSERQNWRTGPLKAQIHKSKVLFECGVEDCPFTTRLYYLFESHITTNHSTEVWTGECDGCNSQMNVDKPFPLIVALKHLVLHINESKNNRFSGLGNGDKNVVKLDAHKTKVTKSLKKSKMNDPGHCSLKSGLATANNPNNNEAEEENVSTNHEEEKNACHSIERSTNGDENLNLTVQDVPAVIPQQAPEINCNDIGSVMKTQIQDCHINVVHTPVWNSFNSPPVIAPVIPIHTPIWEEFSSPPVLTPAVPCELNTPVWEGFRSPPVVTFIVPSGIQTPVISGFNSPFVIESSQPLEAQTPFGGDLNPVYIPTAAIQPSAQTPAVGGFSSPLVYETSQTPQTIRNSTASVYVPTIFSLPGSPTPAIVGSNTNSVDRASQTSEFQTPVRRSTDSVPITNTSDTFRSQSPATVGSNYAVFVECSQSSKSQSPDRDCANSVYDPKTSNSPSSPTLATSNSNPPFVETSPQTSRSQSPVKKNTDSVSVPITSNSPRSPSPAAVGSNYAVSVECSQSSKSQSPVRDCVNSVYDPKTSNSPLSPTLATSGSNPRFVDRSSQTCRSQSPVKKNTDSVSVPITSNSPRSQSPATGFPNSPVFVECSQSSKSQSPDRDCANSVYDPTTPNSPHSPTLATSGSNPPFVKTSPQTSRSQSPVRKNTESVSSPITRNQTPDTISFDSSVSLEFSHSSASQTPIRDSTDSVSIPIASNPPRSQTPSTSGFNFPSVDRSSQPFASQTVLRKRIYSASVPLTSNSPRSQSPATGFPNSPVFVECSQSSRSQSPVRNKIPAVSIPTATSPSRSPTPDPDSFSSYDFLEDAPPSASQTPVRDCTNSDPVPTASNPSRFPAPSSDSFNSKVFFESSCPSKFQIPRINSQPHSTSSSLQLRGDSVRSTPSYSIAVILDKSCNQQFTLSPERQEFLKKKMHFPGHIISEDGVHPNPKSLQAIRNFSTPSNHAEVRNFLKLVRYCRRFVKGFSEISSPLVQLSKQKDVPFIWNEAEQKSFSELKRIFVTEPTLHFPDFNERFILTTESCYYAISCVLSQGEIENGRVIAYGSRKLAENEKKFSATEKELLAIVWGVKYFEPYLKKQSFMIVTSHEPLTWLITCEDLGGRMAKFRQQLLNYHFKLVYCDKKRPSGPSSASQIVSHCNTSRAPRPFGKFIKFHYTALNLPKLETVITNQTSHTPFVLFYSKDLSNYNPLSHYIRNNYNFNDVKEPDNVYDVIELINPEQTIYLCICRHFHFEQLRYQDIAFSLEGLRNLLDTKDYSGKIFIHDVSKKHRDIKKDMFSELVAYTFKDSKVKVVLLQLKKITPTVAEKRKVLEDYHRTKRDEHSGFRKTYASIKEKYKWKSMKSDIFNYIRHCRTCQDKDTDSEIIKFSKSAFKKLNVNVIGPLPQGENGNAYILTIQDLQTKYSYSIALPDSEIRTVCAEFRKFINIHGPPRTVSSDLGTEFADRLIKDGSQNMDLGRPKSCPLTSQDKLFSLTLRYRLMMFVLHYKYNDWDVVLPLAVFILNFRYQSSAAYVLFEKILKLVNGPALTN